MMSPLLMAAAACLVLSLGACHRPASLTAQEQTTVKALTDNLKTRCVGRYLIDMPDDAPIFGSTRINGVTIESKAMSQADYQEAMAERSEELKSAKSYFGYRFLYADSTIEGIPGSRYFISLGDIYKDPDTKRIIEAYKWDRGYQIKMSIEASDAINSVSFKDDPAVRNDPDMTDTPEKTQRVVSLLDRARGRTDDEIPSEPGACFPGGFLSGPQRDSEDVETHFVLPNRHDVSFDLKTNTDVHDPKTLLQRGDDINAALKQDPNGKSIRKGVVALQNMTAEEWLAKGTTSFKVLGMFFSMEANTLPSNDRKPVVRLDMYTGERSRLNDGSIPIEKASLDEAEALGLWDAVSRTLRPRPNGF
jgi:hypothetical protein